MFSPGNILLGRLALQGVIIHDLHSELTDGTMDPHEDAWAIGKAVASSFFIWQPVAKAGVVGAAVSTSAAAAGAVVTAVAPVTLGYAIGATAGTVVANEIWGPEGASDAIDFYSGQGNYWDGDDTQEGGSGYFNVPQNVETIVDLAIVPAAKKAKKTIASTVKHIVRGLVLRRPKRRRWRFW